MGMNNEELQRDLEDQYAMLENEVQEDKKKKRYFVVLICFLCLFLFMFGTTFSYFKIYDENKLQEVNGFKNLYVEGYEDAYEFDPNIHDYLVVVAPNTTSVTIKYVLDCQNCTVDIKGANDLKTGDNEVKIVLTHKKTGTKKEYIIHILVPEANEEAYEDLDLISLKTKNHSFTEKFYHGKTSYIVDSIKTSEDVAEISFELYDNNNSVELRINGSYVTRTMMRQGNIYKIRFNVKTEFHVGTNKLEIIVKDNKGNSKIYNLFLIVSDDGEEQKIIEINVEYNSHGELDNDGNVYISEIIPGWQSDSKQEIKITNNSSYDTSVDINWTEVNNNFSKSEDLQYFLYEDNTLIKTDALPMQDSKLLKNISIPANSVKKFYISYKYMYLDIDQNIDQGKEFRSKLSVTLSK